MKELSVTERNKIGLYIAKLINEDKGKAIKDVAVASWSIGTAYLRVYIIFRPNTVLPADITAIIDNWSYEGITGTDTKLTISTEYADEYLPKDLTYLYKDRKPIT